MSNREMCDTRSALHGSCDVMTTWIVSVVTVAPAEARPEVMLAIGGSEKIRGSGSAP